MATGCNNCLLLLPSLLFLLLQRLQFVDQFDSLLIELQYALLSLALFNDLWGLHSELPSIPRDTQAPYFTLHVNHHDLGGAFSSVVMVEYLRYPRAHFALVEQVASAMLSNFKLPTGEANHN